MHAEFTASSLYYREFSFGSYCEEAAARATSHFSYPTDDDDDDDDAHRRPPTPIDALFVCTYLHTRAPVRSPRLLPSSVPFLLSRVPAAGRVINQNFADSFRSFTDCEFTRFKGVALEHRSLPIFLHAFRYNCGLRAAPMPPGPSDRSGVGSSIAVVTETSQVFYDESTSKQETPCLPSFRSKSPNQEGKSVIRTRAFSSENGTKRQKTAGISKL